MPDKNYLLQHSPSAYSAQSLVESHFSAQQASVESHFSVPVSYTHLTLPTIA